MLKATEAIARVPRSQLQTAELLPGYVAPLVITFAGGSTWRLEVRRPVRSTPERSCTPLAAGVSPGSHCRPGQRLG